MSEHAAQPAATPTNVAAFFDLDKTLIASSSALAFSRELFGHGLISATDAAKIVWAEVIYLAIGHTETRMERLKTAMMNMIDGWDDAEIRSLLGDAINRVITPTIYAEAKELLDAHRNLGHDLILISASPLLVVEPIAELLGIPTTVATELGLQDGIYNGTIHFYCKGQRKAEAMQAIAAERGYDLSRCFAYSDSIVDLPMLTTVGHPVAVNPDRSLRKEAAARHWPVRRFTHPLMRRSITKAVLLGFVTVITTLAAGWALIRESTSAKQPAFRIFRFLLRQH
ncbi:HAD family hydrolase [Corynebacterium choanae]|uniref:Haloacid dehalogenase-like hydrolase n=1 Tax=Corynebacterium choanae TaxID=1862358 RepID=A0A3G6J9W2_9CORY|nr:HAD family hydrolase [Corynebacterium choanae]AZA14553.1 haloacid dehalogenase-like hydrolase [Corynebacterium choanae]